MTTYTYEIYDIQDDQEFAEALSQTIIIIKKIGASKKEINKVIDMHIQKWFKRQEELGNKLNFE